MYPILLKTMQLSCLYALNADSSSVFFAPTHTVQFYEQGSCKIILSQGNVSVNIILSRTKLLPSQYNIVLNIARKVDQIKEPQERLYSSVQI